MYKPHHKKKNNTLIIIIVVAILFIGGVIALAQTNKKTSLESDTNAFPNSKNAAAVETLAQCITEKGMKMYGADWCPHCKKQKEMFGESFAKVDYVECTTDQVKCNIAGVEGYPTWIHKGQKYEWIQTFENLAKITGCEYNGE